MIEMSLNFILNFENPSLGTHFDLFRMRKRSRRSLGEDTHKTYFQRKRNNPNPV